MIRSVMATLIRLQCMLSWSVACTCIICMSYVINCIEFVMQALHNRLNFGPAMDDNYFLLDDESAPPDGGSQPPQASDDDGGGDSQAPEPSGHSQTAAHTGGGAIQQPDSQPPPPAGADKPPPAAAAAPGVSSGAGQPPADGADGAEASCPGMVLLTELLCTLVRGARLLESKKVSLASLYWQLT